MKRDLTRRGNLDAAIAVNNEIKAIQASAGAVIASPPAEPPPPARAVVPAAPSAVGTSPGVTPAPVTIKPPRDHIWLFALKGGFPSKEGSFTLIGSASKRIVKQQPDAFGKLDVRLGDVGETYHVLLIHDQYEFQEVVQARGGQAYQGRLLDRAPGAGTILVTDQTKEIMLPGAGPVRVHRQPSGKVNEIHLIATKSVFRLPHWSPENLDRFMFLGSGESYEIVDGPRRHEVSWCSPGRRAEPPPPLQTAAVGHACVSAECARSLDSARLRRSILLRVVRFLRRSG